MDFQDASNLVESLSKSFTPFSDNSEKLIYYKGHELKSNRYKLYLFRILNKN